MSNLDQSLDSLGDTLLAERRAFIAAVRLIRHWHGIGLNRQYEAMVWGIYYSKSPEMKPIRDVLGKDPTNAHS